MEAVKRIYICLAGKRLSIKTPLTRWSSLRPSVISDPRAIVARARTKLTLPYAMTSILVQLDAAFRSAIKQAFGEEADPLLTPSQNEKFGDYQSNAAMGLAKAQKANPRQVAEKIKGALNLGDMASEVSIAGPGFINVRLSPIWLASLLQQAGADPRLGIESVTKPETIVVDYSAPNVAKQMHVGHLRSTII